jgi:hypothetical protein
MEGGEVEKVGSFEVVHILLYFHLMKTNQIKEQMTKVAIQRLNAMNEVVSKIQPSKPLLNKKQIEKKRAKPVIN